jgi:uncharacterized protein
MRKLPFLLLIILSFVLKAQDIPPAPNPPRLVNDFVGGLLSESQKAELEAKLVAYNDSTSTDLVIVIVKSVEPYTPEEYALKIGREWKLGQKGKDNGVVLLWAPGDRKISIQTGDGMEGVLPDIYAKRIIRDVMAPYFKELRYYEGLDAATTEIFKYAKGEYTAEPRNDEDPGIMPFIIFLLFLILIIWLISRNRGGRGGGGMFSDSDSSWPYTTYTGWGRRSGNYGGGWIGSGGWSGGDGGGGFGGFGGGGGFSGGGASGDY